MNCKVCQSVLPDLLIEPNAPANASLRAHVAQCADCAKELAELESVFALLDSWSAPEISPYFDQKLAVRLREEQAAPAAGWLERLRTRLALNTGRQFRPALVAMIALLLLAGGGGFSMYDLSHQQSTQMIKASAAVNDLQILDKNEQALQQMDQLLQEDAAPASNNTTAPPQS